MATVDNVIDQAFNALGVTQPGETVSATIKTAALATLIELMANLSVEQAMNYVVYHQTFSLVAGTAAYTVGTAGTLTATANPQRITGWQSISGNFRNGGPIVSFEQFHATVKDPLASRSVLAQVVAADQLYPSINILIWPTPDTAPAGLILDYYSDLPVYSATSDMVTLPSGWILMLVYNLAIALAPQFARVGGIPDSLAADAQNSKAVIAAKNAQILGLTQQAA